MFARLDELILNKRYSILYMEKIRTVDGLELLVKLMFDSVKDIFIILPADFGHNFTTTQMTLMNRKSMYIDLITGLQRRFSYTAIYVCGREAVIVRELYQLNKFIYIHPL